MPSPKNTRKPVVAPSSAGKAFGGRKSNDRGASVTSERIAADLAAFDKAGGRIEVLGNTLALKKIGVDATDVAPAPPAEPPAKR